MPQDEQTITASSDTVRVGDPLTFTVTGGRYVTTAVYVGNEIDVDVQKADGNSFVFERAGDGYAYVSKGAEFAKGRYAMTRFTVVDA